MPFLSPPQVRLFSTLFNDDFSAVLRNVALNFRTVLSDAFQMTLDVEIVAFFKVLFHDLAGRTERNYEYNEAG